MRSAQDGGYVPEVGIVEQDVDANERSVEEPQQRQWLRAAVVSSQTELHPVSFVLREPFLRRLHRAQSVRRQQIAAGRVAIGRFEYDVEAGGGARLTSLRDAARWPRPRRVNAPLVEAREPRLVVAVLLAADVVDGNLNEV